MDYTHFTTDDVMDFIQGRIDRLRRRKQRQVGTTSNPDTRISELTHIRHTIMTRAQSAASKAANEHAEEMSREEQERAQSAADKVISLEKASERTGPSEETIYRMHLDALGVQNACNLSGVVFSFARHMQTLCDMGLDTDAKNRHPVSVLFSSKIASLTGSEPMEGFSLAHDAANNIVDAYQDKYAEVKP